MDKITSPMKGIIGASDQAAEAVEGVGEKADESKSKLKEMSAIDLYAINDAVQNIADQFNKVNEPGAKFDAQLKDLEAIAGITGDALEEMGDKGRETALDFGGDASAMIASYKGILGKLGPDIAQNSEALDLMGRNVATLSKTMNNDAVGAMNALTGSMLQFGGDIDDPMEKALLMTEQMNVMAAASKEGSAEVPLIAASIKQAGNAAASANLSFAETNAVIQALGKGTIYGSEAGVGLRNMLGKMAGTDVLPKNALDKIEALGINYDLVSDKTVPFVDRLKELQKAQSDATLIAQIFGTENQNAVNTILDNIDFVEELQGKIVGTTTATDQANIVMSGYNETMARTKAWFNDLAIGMFDVTSKVTPFVDGLAGAVSVFANMANAGKGVKLLFGTLKTMPVVGKLVTLGSSIASGGFAMMGTAANALGVAIMNIPIIGWIAALIALIIACIVYFEDWGASVLLFMGPLGLIINGIMALKNNWESVTEAFEKDGILGGLKRIGIVLLDAVLYPVQQLLGMLSKIPGLGDLAVKGFNKIAAIRESLDLEGKIELETKEDKKKEKNVAVEAEKQTAKEKTFALEKVSPVLTPSRLATGGNKTSNGLQGSGGGSSIKNITQKIDIKNYFTIGANSDKAEYEVFAEKIVRALNDKLSDGMVAASM